MENKMKILVLLAYYNRPKMVRLALESVKSQNYDNWELAVIDDGSIIPAEKIVKEFFGDDSRVKIYNTEDTDQQKIDRGGSIFGKFWNKAVEESDADIAIMLCDDDALYPEYLSKLNDYYEQNPDVIYSYSHVSIFDPSQTTDIHSVQTDTGHWLNNHTEPINPFHQVDASQVSWRTWTFKQDRVAFPFPLTVALDAALYTQLFEKYGNCVFNGLISQYKGWFFGQLGQRMVGYGILE